MQFSVAITVYKTEHFLPHAVQTVLAQTLSDWEVRVYSDGRAPACETVVRQLEGRIPIFYRRIARKRGAYGNRLRRIALEESRGTHVCYLGHDCLLYPTYLEAHARNIAGRKDALSVVPVAYWKNYLLRRGMPAAPDLMTLGEGEIDLLCIAYPRELSLTLGCFGPDMERIRCADFLSYDRLRRYSAPIYTHMPEQAAHF
jgi:glycosyltransferase involved in cell wall biosynthesis